jgi:formate hydrogenlyase transcriptional activator
MDYTEADLDFLEQVTRPVAVAVENILNRERIEEERDRLRVILEINNALVAQRDSQALFEEISRVLQRYVPHEFLTLAVWAEEEETLRLRYAASRDSALMRNPGYALPLENTPTGLAYSTGATQVLDFARLDGMDQLIRDMIVHLKIRSACSLPLRTARGKIGAISLGSREESGFGRERVSMLESVAGQLAIAVENATAFAHVAELNRRLKETKLYLEEELQEASPSDEILGASAGVRQVLQQIETVAPTDATVLIYGETGSGKELVARALHQKSPRSRGTFVKLNCAAIPTGLLESELFGHEKGAFTGAIAQKIGRFEIAHQGTLFLDEIGEIPLELQPKLLRVLQEKEFERLGGTRTIRSDARLVAATNRNLKRMVDANQFRGDLYYRLNVFPIHVPPLRERREDIPLLAMHFTREFSRRFGRHIDSIPAETIGRLSRYHWPGNIRELQNLIERSVILSSGETLRVPLQELDAPAAPPGPNGPVSGTMEEVERETIRRAIRECNGVIGGPKGAAAKLGMKRTTLLYRMEKLGINGR